VRKKKNRGYCTQTDPTLEQDSLSTPGGRDLSPRYHYTYIYIYMCVCACVCMCMYRTLDDRFVTQCILSSASKTHVHVLCCRAIIRTTSSSSSAAWTREESNGTCEFTSCRWSSRVTRSRCWRDMTGIRKRTVYRRRIVMRFEESQS